MPCIAQALMARLDQLTEYLFTHPGSTLTLDSEGPGFYVDLSGQSTPVFKQTLRSGQILLLFADMVPREQSQDFLAGKPIDFVFETRRGPLSAHMEMKGDDLRVQVKPSAPGDRALFQGKRLAFDPASPAPPSSSPPPPPSNDAPRTTLLSLIAQLAEKRASHLHLAVGQRAFVRVDGRLVCLEELGAFSASDIREAVQALAPQAMRETLGRMTSFDFSHVTGQAVFHVRGQQGRDGLGVVIRALPRQVPTPASLGVPDEFSDVLHGSGLWVVSGGAGLGTSTTVASLVQSALDQRALTVCTIEGPIDYVLESRRGLVQQLEVGVHSPSFALALEDARRGDADLVVVGQLDDAETLAAALSLADRGRLVLGVVHAKTAPLAVQKLVDLGPRGSAALASTLRGVFGQDLVPNTSGGRSLCWELLPGTDAVRALVRDGALHQLGPLSTRTHDQSLMQLFVRGEVDAETALAHARDRALFEDLLTRVAHPRAA
jgi:twitching motility protein PilT